jgi:hypothetical protein
VKFLLTVTDGLRPSFFPVIFQSFKSLPFKGKVTSAVIITAGDGTGMQAVFDESAQTH